MTEKYVYFIKPVGMDGPIKIGLSQCPAQRLSDLAAWSPFELEVITTIPGDLLTERNIQNCFFDMHTHKEWFKAGPRLVEAVAKIKSGVPLHEAVDLTDLRGDIAAAHYENRSRITAAKRGKPYRPKPRPRMDHDLMAVAS